MRTTLLRPLAALVVGGWLGLVPAAAQAPAAGTAPPAPPAPAGLAPTAPLTPAPVASGGGTGGDPGWAIRGEFIYLNRDVPRRSLGRDVLDPSQVAPAVDISTRDNDLTFQPGLRLTLTAPLGGDVGLELAYFTAQRWSAATATPALGTDPLGAVSGTGLAGSTIISPFPVLVFPFDAASQLNQEYNSQLHSGELNLKFAVARGGAASVSLLAGLRYINLEDNFTLSALGPGQVFLPLGLPRTLQAEYRVECQNRLPGVQVGADVAANLGGGLRANLVSKAGLYANIAHQHTSLIGAELLNQTPVGGDDSRTRTDFATAFEVAVRLEWQLGNNLVLSGGYQALYLTGLALGPNNLVFDATPGAQGLLDNSGSMFVHGPTAGVELRW
jgi:hypothetical protein